MIKISKITGKAFRTTQDNYPQGSLAREKKKIIDRNLLLLRRLDSLRGFMIVSSDLIQKLKVQ